MAEPVRKRMPGEQRRCRIINAAVEVFAEKGYAAASVEDVSLRAGVSKPVIYDHFPSKRAMHTTVLHAQRDDALREVLPRLSLDLEPREAVANALEVFLAWMRENPCSWKLLFGEPQGSDEHAAMHRRLRSEAYLAITAAVLTGPARPSDDRMRATAEVIGGAVHGAARWWQENPDVERDQVIQSIMDVIWQGLDRMRQAA